jgi:hypothetical protein
VSLLDFRSVFDVGSKELRGASSLLRSTLGSGDSRVLDRTDLYGGLVVGLPQRLNHLSVHRLDGGFLGRGNRRLRVDKLPEFVWKR